VRSQAARHESRGRIADDPPTSERQVRDVGAIPKGGTP
jgi:hypothetical protein